MDITGKLELSIKQFVNTGFNPNKTHILVGQASGHSIERFNDAGEIMTSNVMYVEINGGIVYAVTHYKSRYQLTNVSFDEITQMIKDAAERGINIPLYNN
ncbi:hypothetical protein phiGrn1_0229 [Vibrio phage phi-Grn1]|uniref:Uncharacterized protein n=1 Tax=Vibrio phage phi-Grn1 TaxID=1747713 RepID=A0A140B3K5_9CAUD|nr:hypothetical protein phiGrn1_0229 [Vibrio phage phi-Grn1]